MNTFFQIPLSSLHPEQKNWETLSLLCYCHLWLNTPCAILKMGGRFLLQGSTDAFSTLYRWLVLAHLPYTLVTHCKYATLHTGIFPKFFFKLFNNFHKLQFLCCSQQATEVSQFSFCHVELLQKQSLVNIFKWNFLTYRPWSIRRKITTGYWKTSELQGH